ncbi:MAG: hypothetical protein HYR60_24040 [Acidobacteria bacterium]|nr:hypothetical protein [Acidobacteriota bacterium]MBI3470111.1 hypothetical protein [Candidatus Solibacter usitatus]
MHKPTLILFCLGALAPAAELPKLDESRLKSAVTRAMTPLEKQSPVFVKTGGCNSCHNQDLPTVAQAIARERGIPAGGPIELFPGNEDPELNLEHSGAGGAGGWGYTLLREAARKRPLDSWTDSIVEHVLAAQDDNGGWKSTSTRQPLTTGAHYETGFGVFILERYARGGNRQRAAVQVSRAVAWLKENAPASNQDSAFQTLGLVWGKAERAAIHRAAAALQARQREDGGWSQLPSLASDAYATGQALYALALSGTPASDPVYRRGLNYLLRTQAGDGTWLVKARSKPVQPYFDAGFPYGHDQWISAAGTSWAVMAISMAVKPPEKLAAARDR